MPTLTRGKVLTRAASSDLAADWFERDPGTFVKVSAEYSIDWTEESHSSFLLKGRPDGWNMVEQSYLLIKSLLTAMDLPNRFSLRFHRKESFTDGKSIYVSTQILDETKKSVEQRVAILLGLGAHEGCHLKYTDMKYMSEWAKALPPAEKNAIFGIFNVLEDERIEQELGADLPGLVRYLVPLKRYYFEELYERELELLKLERRKLREKDYREALRKALAEDAPLPDKPAELDVDEITDLNALERLMDTFVRIVRYPKNIPVENLAYFGKYLFELKDLLTPYPDSTISACATAEKVWALFKAFYKAPPAPPEKTPGDPGDEEGEEGESDAPRIIYVNGGGSGSGEGEAYVPRPGDVIVDLGGEPAEALAGDVNEDAKKIVTLLDEVMRRSSEEGKDHGSPSREVAAHDFKVSVIEGDAFEGLAARSFFRKQPDKEDEYKAARNRVMPFVYPLRKALQLNNQKLVRTLKGMRSGNLDEAKLVEASMGVPTVHLQHQKIRTDHVAIGVLIDQSSSMGGRNMSAAIDGAVLLNEALKDVSNIQLFVYGHTADITGSGSTDLYVYREPNHAPKFALGSARAVSQNRDGQAVLEVGRRMRRFTDNPGVLFVLSDGAPCANGYYGPSANEDTRQKVLQVERLKLSVVQIAIESHVPSEEMFRKFVKFTDLSQLARQMGLLVRSLALEKAKIHIE